MSSSLSIFNFFTFKKSKDKVDCILEPLQSMLQLAILSISPIGTKLTIHENILYLQSPVVTQPIIRWYYSDKKDDLYFLYSVIKRFIKWYNPHINNDSPLNSKLYELIVKMSIEGLNNLFKTYSTCESNTVIHVIQMYKNILELNNDKILTDECIIDNENNKINIDEVFIHIIDIYDIILLDTIYHILLLLTNETEYEAYSNMISGFNLILEKSNQQIKQWIKCNLIL